MTNTHHLIEYIKLNLKDKPQCKMMMKTIVSKCYCKKRSTNLINDLNEALDENNIIVSPSLTSNSPALNSWVYFSYGDNDKLLVTPKVSFNPYPHQTLAWNSMTSHYSKHKRGMIIVPTGGGKTTIAAKWLTDNYLSNGYNVLWLAHRIELLEQAQETFMKFGVSKSSTLITSSQHNSWTDISNFHKIVLSTDRSCLSKLEYVKRLINQSERGLYIVVDECHHSVSNSYLNLIKNILELDDTKDINLLGLTATPIRMNYDETQILWKMYDDKYNLDRLDNYYVNDETFNSKIFEVSFSELISRGILAKPIPLSVVTNVTIEDKLSEEELKLINTFGDISEDAINKLANDSSRNKLIVNHYVQNKEKYGKTLVFALNIEHCKTLKNEFLHNGISCEYVAYGETNNKNIIENFKTTDTPQVLITVIKLTEGFDAPCIQSVFLTRPTNSETLFRQMIGRALRGPAAAGTQEGYLVDFKDIWNTFTPVNSDYVLTPELSNINTDGSNSGNTSKKYINDKMLDIAYSILREKFKGEISNIIESLPVAWYQWTEITDGEETERIIIVFSNYSNQFTNLVKYIETNLTSKEITTQYAINLHEMFFRECPDPRPDINEIYNVITAVKNNIEINKFEFEESEKFNPITLAKEFKDYNRRDLRTHLSVIFNMSHYCQKIYKYQFENFYSVISREIDVLLSKEDMEIAIKNSYSPLAIPSDITFCNPEFNLYKIKDGLLNVIDADTNKVLFPEKEIPNLKFIYTNEIVKNYLAKYRPSDNTIIINRIFNCTAIPGIIREYIIYSQICFSLMPHNAIDRNYRERLFKFIPTQNSILEVSELGLDIKDTPNFWYNECDKYLFKLSKIYSINYC